MPLQSEFTFTRSRTRWREGRGYPRRFPGRYSGVPKPAGADGGYCPFAASVHATVSSNQVSALTSAPGLKPGDQLLLLLARAREALSGNPNVEEVTLALEDEAVSGEVYLKDFSRELRYEIYRLEAALVAQLPSAELKLVVLPLAVEK